MAIILNKWVVYAPNNKPAKDLIQVSSTLLAITKGGALTFREILSGGVIGDVLQIFSPIGYTKCA